MNDIPLVQTNNIQDINTSIIAIKRQLTQISELIDSISVDSPDISQYVKKTDVVNVVEGSNLNPVTSNAVANYRVDYISDDVMTPVTSNAVFNALMSKVNTSDVVDTVASSNMHPVTSNAVAEALKGKVSYKGNFDSLTLNQIFDIYSQQNNSMYMGFLGWQDSRCPVQSTCVIICVDWNLIAFSVQGKHYYYDRGTESWVSV